MAKKKPTRKQILSTHDQITECINEIFDVIKNHAKRQKLDGRDTWLFAGRVINASFAHMYNMAMAFGKEQVNKVEDQP